METQRYIRCRYIKKISVFETTLSTSTKTKVGERKKKKEVQEFPIWNIEEKEMFSFFWSKPGEKELGVFVILLIKERWDVFFYV